MQRREVYADVAVQPQRAHKVKAQALLVKEDALELLQLVMLLTVGAVARGGALVGQLVYPRVHVGINGGMGDVTQRQRNQILPRICGGSGPRELHPGFTQLQGQLNGSQVVGHVAPARGQLWLLAEIFPDRNVEGLKVGQIDQQGSRACGLCQGRL